MTKPKTILAVASGGGHWEQLQLVLPKLDDVRIAYVTTMPGLAEKSGVGPAYIVSDCNRSKPLTTLRSALEILAVIRRIKPDVIVTTGAAPGLIALAWGKLLGARTVWIDSVANSERLSMSGRMAGKIADLWLTQWTHLARPEGPHFAGNVL